MNSTSTIFTVGTALRRAESNHLPVEVLVGGSWLRGNVAGVDEQGVILTTHTEYSVVRLDAVSAVRIPETMADRPSAETFDQHQALTGTGIREDDGAFAMGSGGA